MILGTAIKLEKKFKRNKLAENVEQTGSLKEYTNQIYNIKVK